MAASSGNLTQTLDSMWEEARIKFKEATKGMDIGAAPGKMENVLGQLERTYAPPEDSPAKKKAAIIVADVLKVVQLIGGLACQGASMVFSPAGMCFNAVSFLIDGVSRMKGFHSNLASMFDAIKSFLLHFRMLQRIEGQFRAVDLTNLPPEMVLNTNKLMCCFVNMCTCTYKAMKRGKFKTAMLDLKVAFTEDDDGVKAELGKFKSLVEQQDSIKGTITLEEVMKSRSDIKELLEKASQDSILHRETHDNVVDIKHSLDARRDEDGVKLRDKKLAAKLGIGPAKDHDALYKRQVEIFEEIKKSRFPSTGDWLDRNETYTPWRDANRQVGPALLLSGPKGTGKSHLATKIIDNWQGADAEKRVAVAYYFFGDRSERRETDEDDVSAGKREFTAALCCMAYMLQKLNPKYALELENSRDWKDEAELKSFTVEKIWQVLRLATPRSTSFVLVFDGLDQLPGHASFVRLLCNSDERKKAQSSLTVGETSGMAPTSARPDSVGTRYLFTVNEDYLDVMPTSLGAQCLRLLSTDEDEASNISDINLFIDETVKSKGGQLEDLAQDSKNEELFKDFRKKLLEIANGRFSVIENRVRLVRQQLEGEIEHLDELKAVMLSDKIDDQSELAKKVLENLEATLKPREVAQINDMLVWIVWARDDKPLTLEQIDAAAAFNKATANSWQTFSQKVKTKVGYKDLFKIIKKHGEETIAVHDHLLEHLRSMKWQPASGGLESLGAGKPKISLTIRIDQAEPKAVKRFLWDLHEKISYDRSFFVDRGSEVKNREKIHVDEISALSRLLIQCLDLMNDETDDATQILVYHAAHWLPRYLWRATRIEADRTGEHPPFVFPNRDLIISKLIAYLSGDREIDSSAMLGDFEMKSWEGWLTDEKYRRALETWVNEDVAQQLSVEQKRVMRKLLKSDQGPLGYMLPLVRRIARHWLSREDANYWCAFPWVDAFLTARKQYPSISTSDAPTSSNAAEVKDDEYTAPAVKERIGFAATWAEEQLDIKERDSVLLELLANTYDLNDCTPIAIRLWKQAAECSNKAGDIYCKISQAYCFQGEYDESIVYVKKAIENPAIEGDDEEASSRRLTGYKKWLGLLYMRSKRSSEATEVFQDLIKLDAEDHNSALDLLRVMYAHKLDDKGRELLDSMSTEAVATKDGENPHANRLSQVLYLTLRNGHWIDTLSFLQSFAVRTGRAELYDRVVEDTRRYLEQAGDIDGDKRKLATATLLWQQGQAALLRDRSSKTYDEAFGLWSNALRELPVPSSEDYLVIDALETIKGSCAEYYYARMLSADDPATYLKQIKALSDGSDVINDWMNKCKSILSHAYALCGKVDQARALHRKGVEDALEILTDKDPTNDWVGFKELAWAFAHLNDVGNATAALCLVQPDLEKYDKEVEEFRASGDGSGSSSSSAIVTAPTVASATGDQGEDPSAHDKTTGTPESTKGKPPTLTGPWQRDCQGECGHEWRFADEVHVCCVCDDIKLCTSCYQALRDGKLQSYVCHPSHAYFHVPKWERAVYEKIGKDNVRIPKKVGEEWVPEEGEIIPVSEWLDRVRDMWKIEKPVPPVEVQVTSVDDDDVVVLKPPTRRSTTLEVAA